MKKIFLYLYPIKEYTSMFLIDDDFYKKENREHPLDVLNRCIQERYRDKGYEVVFLTYPDREVFGIDVKDEDKVILTDINFQDNSEIDENGKRKENFVPKYANEELIISKLGDIDELVVGGYHYSDCVKRIAEKSLDLGIPTIVDLDLTDLFFSLYYKQEYFQIDNYDFNRYKDFWIERESKYIDNVEMIENWFWSQYDSPIYGTRDDEKKYN